MQTIKFKTSLKCNGCVDAIKPGMDAINEISAWRVYLDIKDKVLEVELDKDPEDKTINAIQDIVKKAGYSIEKL